jgi:predicted RNA-binding Zn-ribbon protein involved in translation (DUF1610 family)
MTQMHCPECGSENVSCVSDRKAHTHTCHDCGYETVAAPVKKGT